MNSNVEKCKKVLVNSPVVSQTIKNSINGGFYSVVPWTILLIIALFIIII